MSIVKHIGEIATSGRRCAVVFMSLPDAPDHALVVDTESLSDRIATPFMALVNSVDAQNANGLYEVMARRIDPNTGVTFMESFHNQGYLQKVSIDVINLLPTPNTRHRLRDVVEAMKNPIQSEESKANFFKEQSKIDRDTDRISVARGIIEQAEMLEQDARHLRQKAYSIAPSLNPRFKPADTTEAAPTNPVQVEATYDEPVQVSVEPEFDLGLDIPLAPGE